MLGAWTLYYAAWAAHIIVGGLALIRGPASARLSILIIATALFVEQALLLLHLSPVPISYLWLEIGTNFLQCVGLFALAAWFRSAGWLIVLLLVKATELALDGVVLQANPQLSHAFLPQVSDALSLLMMTVLAWGMSHTTSRTQSPGVGERRSAA